MIKMLLLMENDNAFADGHHDHLHQTLFPTGETADRDDTQSWFAINESGPVVDQVSCWACFHCCDDH